MGCCDLMFNVQGSSGSVVFVFVTTSDDDNYTCIKNNTRLINEWLQCNDGAKCSAIPHESVSSGERASDTS